MDKSVFSLNCLCESYDSPFMIIDNNLKIVNVNKAWESFFATVLNDEIEISCCQDTEVCRHKNLYKNFEPYSGRFPFVVNGVQKFLSARGFPLLDKDGRMYIGEIIEQSNELASKNADSTMVGRSQQFYNLCTQLEQAANSDVAVLLKGETGTGKELAAKYIHDHSAHSKNNFVVVDCTVLGDNLFESELFGHEKGSFTGANSVKKGLLELANNGTLFIDEIGELPLNLQPKLLRAIESGQFRRVGGNQAIKSNFKIISASHRDLAKMVKNGSFREDLFYRLSVFQIDIPPLRKRQRDIPIIVQHLLFIFGQKAGVTYKIDDAALLKLQQHNWQGNIRELKNCLKLALSLSSNNTISEYNILIKTSTKSKIKENEDTSFKESKTNLLDRIEAELIQGLITKYNGNRRLIALELNITERTLYRKLNSLEILGKKDDIV